MTHRRYIILTLSLRIINLNPYFTLHVDSSLSYQLQINKNPENYFWYLKKFSCWLADK